MLLRTASSTVGLLAMSQPSLCSCLILVLLVICTNRSTGESGRGVAQDLQGRLVKPWKAIFAEISPGHCLYMLQPGSHCRCLRQGSHSVVRNDPMFMVAAMILKMVIAGSARQLSSRVSLHNERGDVGRYPTDK
jgi:hypothetical protein